MPPDGPLNVVVDAGVDDAMALAVLIGCGVPLRQVVATEGSVSLQTTASTTARLLVTLGAAVPVHLGASSGLSGPYPAGRDPFHGVDGFGGAASLLKTVPTPTSSGAALVGSVFASSALTVVAQAVRRGDAITELTWMGGSVSVGGNMTASAEFNAWMDPSAADLVLTSDVPVRMVPLDVTTRCTWTSSDIEDLADCGGAGALIASALWPLRDRDGCLIPHDAVAAIAVLQPSLFGWTPRFVRCEPSGSLTTGATIVDRRPRSPEPNTLVADDVDSPAVTREIKAAIASVTW